MLEFNKAQLSTDLNQQSKRAAEYDLSYSHILQSYNGGKNSVFVFYIVGLFVTVYITTQPNGNSCQIP
jgi:hypothetical protein